MSGADLDTRIADMDFIVPPWGKRESTRIKNKLLQGGIFTLRELTEKRWSQLPPGIGIVLHQIIRAKLKTMGLKLKGI